MADFARYAYAVSRVRALEPTLLTRDQVDRLLNEDEAGLLRWARESVYAEAFANVEEASAFPAGLERHVGSVLTTLERIAPEPEVISTFRLRYDYHNLKSLFKARTLGREPGDTLSTLGTIAPDRLAEFVRDEAWLWIPETMREAWRTATALLGRDEPLLVASAAFDNAQWRHRLDIVRAYDEPLLEELYREAITLHNIVTFVRVKDGAAPREHFDALLIDGGMLERSFFRRRYDEPVQLFLDSLSHTDYARQILIKGVEALPEERQHWRLDVARDNYFLAFLQRTAGACFDAGPLAHFYVRKRSESKLLHSLWLAARAGWDRTAIRARFRSVYA